MSNEVTCVTWNGSAHLANTFIGECYGTDWEYLPQSNSIWVLTPAGQAHCHIGDILEKENGKIRVVPLQAIQCSS